MGDSSSWLTASDIQELGEGLYPPGNTHGLSDPFSSDGNNDTRTPRPVLQTDMSRAISMLRQAKRQAENYNSPSPPARRERGTPGFTSSPLEIASPSGRIGRAPPQPQFTAGPSRPGPSRTPVTSRLPISSRLPVPTLRPIRMPSESPDTVPPSRPIRMPSESPDTSATGYVLSDYQASSGENSIKFHLPT